jgi:carboxymethylenebutenolidase
MCYGDDALPPDHGITGEVAEEEDLTLTSADGTRFMAHLARAAMPSGNGVVFCPDVRGLHNFYCALTRSLAQAGIDAVAFDYFGRSAGQEQREEGWDYQPHLHALDWARVDEDVAAASAILQDDGRVEHGFSMGFCFGGAMALRQAAAQPGLAGAIGFYAVPSRVREVIPRMAAPLLVLVAGDDKATSPEESEKFEHELDEAGVPYRTKVYAGAPHSFFDRSFNQYPEACSDAWKQVFDFIASPPA